MFCVIKFIKILSYIKKKIFLRKGMFIHFSFTTSGPLTLLMNQIIPTGEFPDQLKLSRVKPLFKKGYTSCFSNYRPISCCLRLRRSLSM